MIHRYAESNFQGHENNACLDIMSGHNIDLNMWNTNLDKHTNVWIKMINYWYLHNKTSFILYVIWTSHPESICITCNFIHILRLKLIKKSM